MDITGGQITQTNGNPIFPGAVSTGPLIAGNVVHSDGSGTLAGLGESSGIANQGFAELVQFSASLTQAGTTSATSTTIVLPAQSMITAILAYVTTAWTGGSSVLTVKDTAGNTYGTGTLSAIGVTSVVSGTTKAVVQQWQNVGNTDVQLTVTSTNTGSGLGSIAVRYVQGANSAQTS